MYIHRLLSRFLHHTPNNPFASEIVREFHKISYRVVQLCARQGEKGKTGGSREGSELSRTRVTQLYTCCRV